ncbi:unnamed protein product [Larinioides sclopetarius]|uniref:Alkylglycerol monooxygenase n=1 Tax=Larinioides sclopetarius TaxID=280406 RepID=A0AAV2AR23_9ARAC
MGVTDVLETFGYLFYAVSPNKTTFEKVEDVPDYQLQVVPCFFVLVMLEILIKRVQKDPIRLNDGITSISQGLLSEITRIFLESWKLASYIYIYTNWRLVTLPWDSLWTWWIAFLTTDFVYYWAHRASHEINFLWATHQVHHSSEDYNLTTALRQSVLQSYFVWALYLPLALIVPPTAILVHLQFNLLYQFWIHTEVIGKLGPLEYILNTASHHRVHHGRNRYCIDKNYAAVLIIWDRIFGTFEAEEEKVVYGLTHPINSFEPFYIQACHFTHMWRMFWSTEGLLNKLSVIFKGPGWSPGKPRLGCIEDIPDVKAPVERYDPSLPSWCKIYAFCHCMLLVFLYVEMIEGQHVIPPLILYAGVIYEVLSFSILGLFLEARPHAAWLELLRCFAYIAVDFYFVPWSRLALLQPFYQIVVLGVIRGSFLLSGMIWLRHFIKSVRVQWHSKPQKID